MKKKEDENLNEDSNTGFIILIVVILLVFFALTAGAIQKLKKRKEVLESEKEVKKLQYNKSQNKLELKKEKKKAVRKDFQVLLLTFPNTHRIINYRF